MPANLIACVYVCTGTAAAWAAARFCFPARKAIIARVALSWTATNLLLFLSPAAWLFVLLLAFFLLIASPREPSDRVLYFCALLPIVPAYVSIVIPFPGINYLYVLDYPTLVTIAVLLPLASKRVRSEGFPKGTGYTRTIGLCFCYLVAIGLLDFRSTTVTAGLRQAFHYALAYGVLIYCLGRTLPNEGTVSDALFGILLAGLFVVFIGIMQSVTHWFLYDSIAHGLSAQGLDYAVAFRSRGGELRTPSTMRPIPFGIYMSVCSAIALSYATKRPQTKSAYGLLLLFAIGLAMTGSRGAIVGLAIMILILIVFSRRVLKFRSVVIPTLIFGTLLFVVTGGITEFIHADQYGTFAYRYDLLLNSLHSISHHAWLGTPTFREDPELQLSIQGQHIIDVVNAYLQVILRYGAIGLFLFICPLAVSAAGLLKYRRKCEQEGNTDQEYTARLLFAILIGYAAAIATVSLVDRLAQYYWILVVLSAAASWPRISARVSGS